MLRRTSVFVLVLLMFTACDHRDGPSAGENDPRGRIVSATLVKDWSVAEVEQAITDIDPFLLNFLVPEYPVLQYNLIYETVDVHGAPTIASGAACLPYSDSIVVGSAAKSFPLASYQHGTVLKKSNVASRGDAQLELGLIFASEGYAGALPDYLGLGDSPGFHPYTHANSEATAVTDMIRATLEMMNRQNIPWNEQLFLYGYSQGGHATMAAHRYIQANLRDEMVVTASAPMAGPYDASGVQADVITAFEEYPTPGYLPFILYSYNEAYRIVPDVVALLKAPYDSIIPPMMNGEFSIGEVNSVSSSIPREMVKDSVMAAYENDPNHPLKLALRNNDLWNWVPETPVKMFYCTGDDQVSWRNAQVAYDKFIGQGASPEIVSLYETSPSANHNDCAQPTFLLAKFWFDSLRVK
jgi:pimeloyl-ACP methyl ester carboxylesterase